MNRNQVSMFVGGLCIVAGSLITIFTQGLRITWGYIRVFEMDAALTVGAGLVFLAVSLAWKGKPGERYSTPSFLLVMLLYPQVLRVIPMTIIELFGSGVWYTIQWMIYLIYPGGIGLITMGVLLVTFAALRRTARAFQLDNSRLDSGDRSA